MIEVGRAANGVAASVTPAPGERGPPRWLDAVAAAQLFAIDPAGLGGVAVIGGPGSAREQWLDGLRQLLGSGVPVRRMPPSIADDRLLGGVDLIPTLRAGRPVLQRGLLAEADGGIVVIPMAERMSAALTARIAAALDRHEVTIEREGIADRVATRFGVVALDERASAEEQVPTALLDRLALHLDLRDVSPRDRDLAAIDAADAVAARRRLGAVGPAADEILQALVETAAAFGIETVLAPLLALRTARAAAALAGRHEIAADDVVLAARLVLAPRARALPETEEMPAPGDSDPDQNAQPPQEGDGEIDESPATEDVERAAPQASLEDMVLAAVRSALPDDLLKMLSAGVGTPAPVSRKGGIGKAQVSLLRGRPAGVRAGSLRSGARLALVDTLRAAAPWQGVRRAEVPARSGGRRVELRREDIRIKRFARRRESTIVFCVDASGSTAFHRLAEAKGAVELLLGRAYVARTYAALIAFRGTGAELLLPPTRSLSRAKSLLANLPGGGGTPLAAGIDAAVLTATSERTKGREPLVVILSDGRANIGRDGLAARPGAAQDAQAAARQLGLQRIAAVFVDTSPRPQTDAAALAADMGARYVALPYVDAGAVRDVVLAAAPGFGPNLPRPR